MVCLWRVSALLRPRAVDYRGLVSSRGPSVCSPDFGSWRDARTPVTERTRLRPCPATWAFGPKGLQTGARCWTSWTHRSGPVDALEAVRLQRGHQRSARDVVLTGVARDFCTKDTGSTESDPAATSDSPIPGHGLFKFKELHENPWTIPNLLCVSRIILAPFLGHLIIQQHFHLSLALFTLAGATDLLDGFIARTWPTQKSALGSALDPLADKILISVLYVSLTYAELIPAPLTALVIFRDVGLIAAVFWVRYKTVPPPVTLSKFFNPCYTTAQLKPTLFSKINTAIQLVLVAASLAAPVFHFTDCILLQCLWYVTAVTTAATGYSYWHYGRKTVRVLNSKPPP
ncbi:cardiolipin synthase (CMP-forming) [Synchiropus splendidus]|uniref:cardiolipin synthase (CMP-forming) n=1 Tax=Synchiropus splendidus TaxID=270530 RepID=UPI00237E3250|nr:cardiolipin synthase (CMP-forming) [Synchiropus splendidus]